MVEGPDTNGFKLTTLTRDDRTNPYDPRCALALRRICGTCVHYPGPLKPAGAEVDGPAANTATCGYFGRRCHRLDRAWKCRRWERKGGAQ